MKIEDEGWRRKVRAQIHGIGNVGNSVDIIFPTKQQITDATRKLNNYEKQRKTK